MTESTEATDEFTCSICVEVFREPVTLPCQHSFCRSCLELFVKSEKAAAPSVSSCPICRTHISLSTAELAALPVNIKLAALVDKAKGHDPGCFMCDGETKSAAVTVCVTCKILYCQECFEIMHPLRGPLKQHEVVSLNDFLSHQRDDSPAEVAPAPPTCDQHGDDLSLVCKSCSKLVCKKCLSQHENCNVKEVKQVSEKFKLSLRDKSRQLQKLESNLMQDILQLQSVSIKIQNNWTEHLDEIEKGYKQAIQALETWRQRSTDVEDTKHKDWHLKCKSALKYLQTLVQDSTRTSKALQELLSKDDHFIVQDSGQITVTLHRAQNQEDSMKKVGPTYKQTVSRLLTSLEKHPVLSRHVRVSEKNNPPGKLRFTMTSHKQMLIKNDGSVVEMSGFGIPFGFGIPHDNVAWTDGFFQSGKSEWRFKVVSSHLGLSLYCKFGIAHKGSHVGKQPGKSSWGILIEFCKTGRMKMSTLEDYTWVRPVFGEYQPITGPVYLLFRLDCEARTLTSYTYACSMYDEICTISDIDVSKELIPSVVFRSEFPSAYVSVSLI